MIQNPLLRILFWPVSVLYATVARVREILYQAHLLPTVKVSPRLISIGNLTVGGTGKTPFTIWVAQCLRKRGQSVVVLSHGWKRDTGDSVMRVSDAKRILVDAATSGDEAQLMARKLPGIPVVVGISKRRAARWIEAHLPSQWIVLDDGFQHLALARDLNILLLDAERPFDNGRTIPLGRLREGAKAVRRADVIVLVGQRPGASKTPATETLTALNPRAPLFHAHRKFDTISSLDDKNTPSLETVQREKLVAFCGLARPEQFFEALEEQGLNVAEKMTFPDHHRYRGRDTARIIFAALKSGATGLITTAKDAMNLEPRAFGNWLCFVFEIKMVCEDENRLVELLFAETPVSVGAAPTIS